MKEIFFKGIAVALPLIAGGGLVYLVFHGFYSVYADLQLKKELEQIRRVSEDRRRLRSSAGSAAVPQSTVEDLYNPGQS